MLELPDSPEIGARQEIIARKKGVGVKHPTTQERSRAFLFIPDSEG